MGASSQLREELLCFFAEPVPPYATKRNAKAWAKVQIELGQLKSAAPVAVVVGSPANTCRQRRHYVKESWETHLSSKFTRSLTKTTARSTLELPGEIGFIQVSFCAVRKPRGL